MNIADQIKILGEKIDYISQNTQFTINVALIVLTLAIAISGGALFFLSKMWVSKGVKEELGRIKTDLKEEMKEFISINQQYVIKSWDSAPTTQYKVNGEYTHCIPIYAGKDKLIQPPFISVYKKNKNGERRAITDFFTVDTIDDYPSEEGENRIYICLKERRFDGEEYGYIVRWEKDMK